MKGWKKTVQMILIIHQEGDTLTKCIIEGFLQAISEIIDDADETLVVEPINEKEMMR